MEVEIIEKQHLWIQRPYLYNQQDWRRPEQTTNDC